MDKHLAFKHAIPSTQTFWESLKTDVKDLASAFSRSKRKNLFKEKRSLTNRTITLKNQLAAGLHSVKAEILELEASLRALLDSELEGDKIRSRAQWLEEGETPSKFFLNLANQRRDKCSVSCIWNANGEEVTSLPDMLKAHETFYTELFSAQEIDTPARNELLTHVQPHLSEATQALKLCHRNKTPGSDGLTVEFHSIFWDQLGPILVETFNESLQAGELCVSMKESITRLIHKKDERKNLKN